jgi:hypothetical protein
MAQSTIEERVARLEQLMSQLLQRPSPELQPGRDDWRRTFGMFAGDPIMKEIIDAGKQIRDDERRNTES